MLAELVEELLDECRWLRILAYSNQYLVSRHVKADPAERDRVLAAATRAVERDGRLHEWQERIAQVKSGMLEATREVKRARRDLAREAERGTQDGPGPDESDAGGAEAGA